MVSKLVCVNEVRSVLTKAKLFQSNQNSIAHNDLVWDYSKARDDLAARIRVIKKVPEERQIRRYARAEQALTKWLAASHHNDKPVMIGEFASDEGSHGQKALWIKNAFETIPQYSNLRAVVWFNANKEKRWSLNS